MPTPLSRPALPRLARSRFSACMVMAVSLAVSAVMLVENAEAAIVYFPVSSGGSISQPADGQQPVSVAFGSINLGAGTFSTASTFGPGNAPSFGIGFNPTNAPPSQYFFSQSNNSVAWLDPAGTVSLLSAGATIGSGIYSGNDPNFGADWRAGVAPGYAGLKMTSGTDVYYGWASIDYVVGSPNQVTVTAFAFENQPNTPIAAAAVPEPASLAMVAGAGAAFVAAVYRRRSRFAARPC